MQQFIRVLLVNCDDHLADSLEENRFDHQLRTLYSWCLSLVALRCLRWRKCRKPPPLVPGCIISYTPVTLAGFQTRGPSAQTAGLFICFLLSLGGWDLLPDSLIAFSRVSIIDMGLAWCNNDDARGDCVVTTETGTEVILKFCYCPGCGFQLFS